MIYGISNFLLVDPGDAWPHPLHAVTQPLVAPSRNLVERPSTCVGPSTNAFFVGLILGTGRAVSEGLDETTLGPVQGILEAFGMLVAGLPAVFERVDLLWRIKIRIFELTHVPVLAFFR